MNPHDSTLEQQAFDAGRKARNAIRRGDATATDAFHSSGVGYPYMTSSEYAKALASFRRGAR